VLFAAYAAVLALIGTRLAHVQCVLPDGLIGVFNETIESWEEIPARDGRILSADGVPLAENEEQYDLAVDYRWIEEPANAEWLRHRALALLHRRERRDPERLAAAEAAVLSRRRELWRALSELTRCSEPELQHRRRRIEDRVERMWERVEARRATAENDSRRSRSIRTPRDALAAFWQELTTPPPRQTNDPLVIAEQEQDHVLLEAIPADVAAEIETHPERYSGVRMRLRSRRIYPERDLAVHLIGARTSAQPDETAGDSAKEPARGNSIGRSGVERSYDALLSGRRGLKKIVRNRQREIVAAEIVREPRPGQDLVLTFDAGLQRRAEELLDEMVDRPANSPAILDEESNREQPPVSVGPRGACLVALDVRTGAVLAAAAAPRFDNNLLIQAEPERWQAVLEDPRRPLFPRVTQMALPPGSTFKTLSAIALVEDGGLDPEARFLCQGYLDRPDKNRCLIFRHYGVGHSETNLADALCRSCNVYFFTAARAAGPGPLIQWSRKLGMGQPTGMDVPGESAGHLPSPAGKTGRPWYPGDTLGLVIGQSSLLVTPLQMARLMTAVANGGALVTPHVVAGVGQVFRDESLNSTADDSSEFQHGAHVIRPEPQPVAGLQPNTLAVIRDGLERVVNDRHGTAYKTVRLPEVRIAGKTGTAEVGGRLPDHAWFAGYVPAEDPRVAFVVVVEHGGSGGKVAGPVAQEFVKLLLERGVIAGSNALAREDQSGIPSAPPNRN
jgi:penicillin-binding protein 2